MKKAQFDKNNLTVVCLAASLLLSSCSFQGNSLCKEQAKPPVITDTYVEGTGDNVQRFLSSFLGTAQHGFSVNIDDVECQLGKNFNNIIEVKEPYKAKGDFIVRGPSLHEIEFDLDFPLIYNGLTRGLEICLSSETLYFAIYNLDDVDSYDVKYKVSLAPYDTIDPETGLSVDNETGGIYQYEYGDLDWVIDDIIESLTGERVKIDEESDKSSIQIDTEEIIDSLENITEGTLNNAPYFIWDLPLGDKTLNIGLRGDPLTYQWVGIDFPSKAYGGFYSLSSDVRLSASASILTGNISSIPAPNDGDAYVNLKDSMSLFHKIIDYANAEKFSVVTRGSGLSLKHKEDDYEGDGVFFNKTSIDEAAILSLRADIDVTDKNLQSIYAGLDYSNEGNHQLVNAYIDGSATDAFSEVYASINNLQKAKTSKTVIDSVVGALDEMLTNGGIKGKKKDKSGGGLAALGGALTDAINAVKESDGMQNMTDGNYEGILEAITNFQAGTDSIIITLDLEVFGMMGFITLHLMGDPSDPSVGYIKFDNVEVYPFSLDGEIDVVPYEGTPMSDEEKAQYKELRHLESLSDQFLKISETNQVKLGMEGYVLTKDTTSVATQTVVGNKTNVPHNQGFTFNGTLGINGNTHQSTGSFVITDRKESFVNDHNLKFDITGAEPKDEEGNPTQTEDFVYTSNDPSTSWMLFEYDSRNPSGSPSSERRTEPNNKNGLKGRFAMHSVLGLLDVVKTLFLSGDPRLDRIVALITNLFINSLIGDLITGQYFKVLGSDLITSIILGDRQDVFELPASVIGGESPLKITLNYGNDVNRDDGLVIGGEIESMEIDMSIGVSNIYVKIDLLGNEMQAMNWPNIDATTLAQFSNFSSLKTLAEYGVNMFLAGDEVEAPGGKTIIRSAYRIEGNIEVDLPLLSDININFKAFVRVEGADIRIAAYLSLPINPLINSAYPGVLGIGGKSGTRYVNFLFHTSGNDDGMFLIDRWDDYGKKGSRETDEDFHYQTRMDAAGMKADTIGYITKDVFGLNSTILNMIDSNSSSSGKQALHGEDLIKSLTFNNNFNAPEWYLDISTAALLHNNLIGDIKLTLGGTYAGGKKLLNRVKTRESVSILSIISADLDCEIKNFSPDYYYCWNDSVSDVPYNIKHETQKILFTTRHYYTTQYHSVNNNSFYESNFLTVNQNGSITLASGYASLPLNPAPNNHL